MTCVQKLPHEECGSNNGLQVFYDDDKEVYSGYCFSCSTYVQDPYGGKTPPKPKVKTDEEIFQEVQEIRELPTVPTKYRGIPAKFYSQWGVRQGVSEVDGRTPFALYFGYTRGKKLLGWKVRMLSKKAFWSVGATRDADPYGYLQARKRGGKRIYITEGEFDSLALDYAFQSHHEMIKKPQYGKVAIVSLPGGVSTMARTIKKVMKHWEEIVLVVDNDEPGREALKEAQKLCPDVLMADMPMGCKDANDAAEAGQKSMSQLVKNCLWNAHKPPIKGVIQVSEIIDKSLEKPSFGLSYPWDSLTEMTYGQRMSECIAWGAGVGLGKSLISHEIAAHNIIVHDAPSFVVALEEQNVLTLRNVAGKIDSIPYHKPDAEYDIEQFRETAEKLQGKLILWSDSGDQAQRFDLDTIITAIRFNVAEFGVKFVTIDNMTRLVDGLSASDANAFINKYSSELEALSNQLDIHIDCYSHLNKPTRGSHEAGAEVYASQYTGSRGLMRSFPTMIGFERNKHSEGELKSRSYISVIKNRLYGSEGKLKTQYFPKTGRLLQNEWVGDTLETGF